MEHVRIDEGIERGKRKQVPATRAPHVIESQARDEAGKFLTRYNPELRDKAMGDALLALECGARVEIVGEKHGIPLSTLYSWLIGDPRTAKYRTQFFDGQAARNLVEIREAASPLELARARHELDGWVKVAERRDPKNWAQKQEITLEITGDLGDKLRRAKERVIEGVAVAVQQPESETKEIAQVIDSNDGAVQQSS